MVLKFNLKIGETRFHTKDDKEYKIACDLFKNHDHKDKPIYYYHDGMKDDDIVATVEGNDSPTYDSPYSTTVKDRWTVFRENVVIEFKRNGNSLDVQIKEK